MTFKRMRMQLPLHGKIAEFFVSLCALSGALLLNFLAGRFADAAGSGAHTEPDLLWRRLPFMDTTLVFVWGFGAFFAWLVFVSLWRERRRSAYIAWSYALLIALRSFFIILTPMRLPPEAIHVEHDWLYHHVGRYLTFRHDLFFSSHTALPFLAFLIMRGTWVRFSFLFFSLLLAASVLLGRMHYSIDVFSAFFITYALHKAEARWFQPAYAKWRRRFESVPHSGIPPQDAGAVQ